MTSKPQTPLQTVLKDVQEEDGRVNYGEGSTKTTVVTTPENVNDALRHFAERDDMARDEIINKITSTGSISGERKG